MPGQLTQDQLNDLVDIVGGLYGDNLLTDNKDNPGNATPANKDIPNLRQQPPSATPGQEEQPPEKEVTPITPSKFGIPWHKALISKNGVKDHDVNQPKEQAPAPDQTKPQIDNKPQEQLNNYPVQTPIIPQSVFSPKQPAPNQTVKPTEVESVEQNNRPTEVESVKSDTLEMDDKLKRGLPEATTKLKESVEKLLPHIDKIVQTAIENKIDIIYAPYWTHEGINQTAAKEVERLWISKNKDKIHKAAIDQYESALYEISGRSEDASRFAWISITNHVLKSKKKADELFHLFWTPENGLVLDRDLLKNIIGEQDSDKNTNDINKAINDIENEYNKILQYYESSRADLIKKGPDDDIVGRVLFLDITSDDKLKLAAQYGISNIFNKKQLKEPKKWEVLSPENEDDYENTHNIVTYVQEERTKQLLKERGLDKEISEDTIKELPKIVWTEWKKSSTSHIGFLLQLAAADELHGQARIPDKIDSIEREEFLNDAIIELKSILKTDRAIDVLRLYAKATWETSQYALHKAKIEQLPVWRGWVLSYKLYDSMEKEEIHDIYLKSSFVELNNIQLKRNGAWSTTTLPEVANSWGGMNDIEDDIRIVQRMIVDKTHILSLPVFGGNDQHEQEVVTIGFIPHAEDFFLNEAPDDIKKYPIGGRKQKETKAMDKDGIIWIDPMEQDWGKPNWLYNNKQEKTSKKSIAPSKFGVKHKALDKYQPTTGMAPHPTTEPKPPVIHPTTLNALGRQRPNRPAFNQPFEPIKTELTTPPDDQSELLKNIERKVRNLNDNGTYLAHIIRNRNVNPSIVSQFEGKGIATLDELTEILNSGKTEEGLNLIKFHDDKSPFVIISQPRQKLDNGIPAVIIGKPYANLVHSLETAFPGIHFFPADEAPTELERTAAMVAKPIARKSIRQSPFGMKSISNENPTKPVKAPSQQPPAPEKPPEDTNVPLSTHDNVKPIQLEQATAPYQPEDIVDNNKTNPIDQERESEAKPLSQEDIEALHQRIKEEKEKEQYEQNEELKKEKEKEEKERRKILDKDDLLAYGRTETGRAMKSGAILSRSNLDENIKGSNGSHIVTIDSGNGKEIKALLKPAAEEQKGLRADIPNNSYFTRGAVYSTIARMLGAGHLVPEMVLRDVDGQVGSVQEWHEGMQPAAFYKKTEPDKMWDGEENIVLTACLDYFLGNTDRRFFNWGVKEDGNIIMYDNDLCLPEGTFSLRGTRYVSAETLRRVSYDKPTNVPEYVKRWINQWDTFEKLFEEAGISKVAIGLAKNRFDTLVAHAGKQFSEMQAPDESGKLLNDWFI